MADGTSAIVAIVASGLFLAAYGTFLFHMYKVKTSVGISPWFVPLTGLPFIMLSILFLVKWLESMLLWHLAFLSYYVIGSLFSIVAFIGWRRFRDDA